MITKRIIPCLDVKNGRVVKGVKFQGVSDVSSPVELGRYYSENGADELVFYDADRDKGLSYELDFAYSEITCGNGFLLVYSEERCLIVGEGGQLVYNGSFSGSTYQMVVTDLHTLLQVGDYGMREVKLK